MKAISEERIDEKDKFLKAFAFTKSPAIAAQVVGRDRRTVYRWREEDKEFKARWEEVYEGFVDSMEAAATRHATRGYLRPIYQMGRLVGYERVMHPQLTMFMLAKLRKRVFGSDIETQIAETEAKLARLRVIAESKKNISKKERK